MTRIDLLIIGGGIHGVAVAYEAARRGRSFCLVDRADFGEGASSSSLKILHGGLRYLQSLDLGRSRESVRARRRLMTLAPHLVRPLRCRMNLSDRSFAYALLFRAGLMMNDLVTYDRNRGVPASCRLPSSSFPCWHDAIVEDTERLLMSLLSSALERSVGSLALNHTRVEELRRDGETWRAALHDDADGDVHEVSARAILRCVGAHRADTPAGISMNLVVDPLPLTAGGEAVALLHPEDGRNVFVVPWRGHTMVGTWDRAYPHDPEPPIRLEPAWVDELLAWLAPVHPELRTLDRGRVRLVHAGLLPLVRRGGALLGTARVRTAANGAIDVVGVKYTTALGIAETAMRAVDAQLGAPTSPVGAEALLFDHAETLRRFEAAVPGRGTPVAPGSTVTRGAVEHAVRTERARTLDDVLLRRTGAASAGHPGTPTMEAVAVEMARLLGWTEERRAAEQRAFDEDWRFAGGTAVAGEPR